MNNCALSYACTNMSVYEQDSVSRLQINETTSNLSISRVEPISVITHADRLEIMEGLLMTCSLVKRE